MQDARGFSVAELKAAGITFSKAEAGQRDAVMITKTAEGVNIAVRDDALNSRGDAEARGAAHVANGVRQAQTYRDHSGLVAWGLVKARGWISGARTHKELAPNDLESRPTTPSDQNLMTARKILDQKTDQFDPDKESMGPAEENELLRMFNTMSKVYGIEELFNRYMSRTKRDGSS